MGDRIQEILFFADKRNELTLFKETEESMYFAFHHF